MVSKEAHDANLISESETMLIGRSSEIQGGMAVLSDPDAPSIVAIDGMEGIGKTALARTLAEISLRGQLFVKVVWERAPAKGWNGVKDFQQLTFGSVLDAIGRQLGALEIARLRLEEKEARV